MVDFVHRFFIRSVKTLCFTCSVMVLFSSSLLRKFLVFCGLVKVLGPWCTINFRLVQFVNIQDYWITIFLLNISYLIIVTKCKQGYFVYKISFKDLNWAMTQKRPCL